MTKQRWISIALFVIVAIVSGKAYGQITIDQFSGDVQARSGWTETWHSIHQHPVLKQGDAVRTGDDGTIRLRYRNGVSITVKPRSIAIVQDEERVCAVNIGTVRFGIPKGISFEVMTPIAFAGVRGTDFGVDVEATLRTIVYVFEGLVGVANSQMPQQEVLVKTGEKTVVEPFRLPTPPVSFESGEFDHPGGLGLLERGEDPIIESSEQPAIERYLAFTDPDIDALRNPAYLTGVHRKSSTSLFTVGGYSSFSEQTALSLPSSRHSELSGKNAIFQHVAGLPVGQSGAIGSFIQGMRTDDRTETPVGDGSPGLLQGLMSNIEGRFIVAKRFGRHSAGISAMRYGSEGHQRPAVGDTVDISNRVTAFDAGTVLNVGDWQTLGIDLEYQHLRTTIESKTLSKDPKGWMTRLEVLYRQPIGAHFLGLIGRVERSSTREVVTEGGKVAYRERIRVNAARGGIGLGFLPSPHTVIIADAVGGFNTEKATQRLPDSPQVREGEEDFRLSASLHIGTQIRPIATQPWVFTTDILHVFERSDKDFRHFPGSPDASTSAELTVDYTTTASAGIGYLWRGFFFDYLLALTGKTGNVPPVHQLLVRYEHD